MTSRSRLLATATSCTVALATHSLAIENLWTGEIDNDWNNVGNWSLGRVPTNANGNEPPAETFDDAVINTLTNFPVITGNLSATPRDIIVGRGSGSVGRVDHNAGTSATGDGNWMFVGHNGGTGEYNISGTGSLNVNARLLFGAGAGAQGTLNVHGGSLSTRDHLVIGEWGGNSVANVSAGQVNVGGEFWIGQGDDGNGTLNFSGGVINSNNWVAIGRERVSASGAFVMTGGTWNKTGGGNFIIGDNGTGTGDHTGGAIHINNDLWIGQGSGSGTYHIAGSGEVSVGNWFAIGRDNGQGKLVIDGDAVVTKTGVNHLVLATGLTSTGTIDQYGGTLNNTGLETWVGENAFSGMGTAVYNMHGGTANLSVLRLGHSNTPESTTGSSTFNLNGGVVSATQVDSTSIAANRVFNFNGGTLKAAGSNETFMQGLSRANVRDDGAVIDTGEHTVTIHQNLERSNLEGDAGTGGLTKKGGGTLVLGGNNTYEGLTKVEEGTLSLASGASIAASSGIHLEAGSTLDISSFESWTLGDGQTLSGSGDLAGNLHFDGGSFLSFDSALQLAGGSTVTFAEGFGIANLFGLDASTANDTYTLIIGDGVDSTGLENFGFENAYDLGGGKLAWFETGSLQVIVVPEPSVALLGGLGALTLLRRRRS